MAMLIEIVLEQYEVIVQITVSSIQSALSSRDDRSCISTVVLAVAMSSVNILHKLQGCTACERW